MTDQPNSEPFIHRYLDPASRLSEILFGLIMVLSVTLTAGLTVAEGAAGVRQLLLAALGCNVAWGIIDGVMYVMNLHDRTRGKGSGSFRPFKVLPTNAQRSTSSTIKSSRDSTHWPDRSA